MCGVFGPAAKPTGRPILAPVTAGAIRNAGEDDLQAIAAILNAGIATRTATAQLDPVDVDDRRAWLRRHDARHPVWVVTDTRGVTGWLSVTPWSERAAYDATAEVSVYVAPDRQGRGLGAALLGHAIEHAPRLGIEVYIARIFAHNPASLRLFERLGFERWGVMPGVARVEGALRDVVILSTRV
ncbi:MAG: GNAT family N-acetyltransferase [Candidatus Elarobacter sp.]